MKKRAALAALILLGSVGTLLGSRVAGDWQYMASATITYYAVSLIAGISAVILAFAAMKHRQVGSMSALAVLLLGINQVVGLAMKSVLCYTPG